MSVQLGKQKAPATLSELTHHEMITMSSKYHLTGKQSSGLWADMRGKWRNKVVDFSNIFVSSIMKVLDMIPAAHNHLNAKKQFLNSEDNLVEKHLFFCNDLRGMVKEVLELRGIEEETKNLIQGDTVLGRIG